ncbi:hypothetical protein B0H14DRAFT_2589303 [Mycena olivaceomarginata]|nr:hypothetical protein B0H14DRAFT_2589303 [Mycena olivaceomarginata]
MARLLPKFPTNTAAKPQSPALGNSVILETLSGTWEDMRSTVPLHRTAGAGAGCQCRAINRAFFESFASGSFPKPSWYTEFLQAWIRLEQVGAKAAFYCGEAKMKDVEGHHKGRNSICDRLCFSPPFGFVAVPFLKPFPRTVFHNFCPATHGHFEGRPEKVVGVEIKEGWMEDRSSSSAAPQLFQKQSWSKDVVPETGLGFTPSGRAQWPFKTSLLAEAPQPMPLPAHGLCSRNDFDCLLKAQARGKALFVRKDLQRRAPFVGLHTFQVLARRKALNEPPSDQ